MTPERFAALAQAWGARLSRWPAADRAAAQALLDRTPMLQAVLDREAAFDGLLDAHAIAAPGAALSAAVLAAAPPLSRAPQRARNRLPWQGWWSGAGVAGVGLAGVAAGALAVSLAAGAVLPAARPSPSEGGWAATAFETGAWAGAGNEGVDE